MCLIGLGFMACGTSKTASVDMDAGRDAGAHDSGLAPGECHTNDDCPGGGGCAATVLPPMCRSQCTAPKAKVNECTADQDCMDAGTNMLCSRNRASSPCDCNPRDFYQHYYCDEGCSSNQDCGPGLTCDATHRCTASPCSQPSDCGSANFTCISQKCLAKPCASDSDCANYCVGRWCSAVFPGHCVSGYL